MAVCFNQGAFGVALFEQIPTRVSLYIIITINGIGGNSLRIKPRVNIAWMDGTRGLAVTCDENECCTLGETSGKLIEFVSGGPEDGWGFLLKWMRPLGCLPGEFAVLKYWLFWVAELIWRCSQKVVYSWVLLLEHI